MQSKFLMALPFVALAATANAQTYTAQNKVEVTPVTNSSFSVPSSGRYGAQGTWCAAADYAMRVLGQSGTTRVYIQQAKAANSGPVTFGLDPGTAAPQSVFSVGASLDVPGSNLSIDHAIQFCRTISRSSP
ncbi:hypothetical protein Z945_3518 [Sulfitobacter noctilucae]|uniref:hypothetical protein n=1 Tax=Sulfitobacter noctilucae TaxID=1342302 RepID=UPI0004695F21|nr:hypothetical protein [Sulfitobacter noctilucae]KIN70463.1 hypothetical protein Z945_3518 [Sulfitobacter noctilucae]